METEELRNVNNNEVGQHKENTKVGPFRDFRDLRKRDFRVFFFGKEKIKN